jgi:hypothetical protein
MSNGRRSSMYAAVAKAGAAMLVALLAVLAPAASALALTGQLYGFGWNEYGQLSEVPSGGTIGVISLSGATGSVSKIATGYFQSLIVTSTGQLYAFGSNEFGQLGTTVNNGSDMPNRTPTQVTLPGQSGTVTDAAVSSSASYAVTSSGQLYSFGEDHYGELGREGGETNPTPTEVTLPGASGGVTDQLFAWGRNREGELGNATNNDTLNPNPTPTLVTLPGAEGTIAQIAAGGFHSLALTSTNQLFAWGSNEWGQLGNRTNYETDTPNPTPTISGTGLEGAAEVRFGAREAHITADTATSITVLSPAAAGPETVNVTVEGGGGESASSPADEFTYVAPGPAPTVTKLSPKKGPARGGTHVTITGTGFAGVTSVEFGTSAVASYTVTSPTSIAAVSPPGTTGTVNVTVTTPNGMSAATTRDRFAFEAPTVTAVSPDSGALGGGYEVTVEGTGFALGSTTSFKFGTVAATGVDCTSTRSCTMQAPAASKAGTVNVVAKAGGKSSKKKRVEPLHLHLEDDHSLLRRGPDATRPSPRRAAGDGRSRIRIAHRGTARRAPLQGPRQVRLNAWYQ